MTEDSQKLGKDIGTYFIVILVLISVCFQSGPFFVYMTIISQRHLELKCVLSLIAHEKEKETSNYFYSKEQEINAFFVYIFFYFHVFTQTCIK